MTLISVVIPTFNEAADIARTLDAVLAQTWPRKEVIVVDDSTDRTPEIVASYASRGVRLIRRENRRNGCCGARNVGMLAATGDVILLLNGDVVLAPDFLERIVPHYEEGADFVVVDSRVLNQGSVFARYVGAAADSHYADGTLPIYWSEGFSCRRSAAMAAGLIPGDFPIAFCRDWLFGMRLLETGHKRRFVRELSAGHVAPEAFAEYWQVRRTRGRISVLFKFFIDGVPLWLLPARVALKNLKLLAGVVLVLPLLVQSTRATTFSPKGRQDIPGFWLAGAIERIAYCVGEWGGLASIAKHFLLGTIPFSQALGQRSQWRNWLGERHAVRHSLEKAKA